jgi:hypothetical protein
MAQSSRPQAGNILANPTYVDSGPYTEAQWGSQLFRKVFTTDQQATQGPLLGVDNELAVTFGVGTHNVYVASGAGFCNGHFFENTASVAITVNAPAGGTRQDYVCMVENNANAGLPAGLATNYNTEGNATIPPYSCRLAVVKNGPANFSQTANLYMVRLATLNTQVGYIGSITDVRVFCQYATDLQDNVVTTTKILDSAVTTDKITDLNVTTPKIADDAVDIDKIGDQVLGITARQGGSANNWTTYGTTTYIPEDVRMQCGSVRWTGGAATSGSVTVNFPVAFGQIPLVWAIAGGGKPRIGVSVTMITLTRFDLTWRDNSDSTQTAITFYWQAIGAE